MRCPTPAELGGNTTVTVFDPVNKKGYDLCYGRGESTQVFPTIGLQIYFEQKRLGGCKRVFLCKKFQSRLCRADEMCNSIHACRKKVSEMRTLYPSSENEAGVKVFSKVDNERFEVPLSRVSPTAGSAEAQARLQMAATSASPSADMPHYLLCTDHENRSCQKGAGCERVHVDPRYLHSMRALWTVPCCGTTECTSGTSVQAVHPPFTTHEGPQEWTHFSIQRSPPVENSRLASTKGLRELCATPGAGSISNGCVSIPAAKLCRPHLRRECKWGPECNNVHLCRVQLPQGVSAMPQSHGRQQQQQLVSQQSHLSVPGVDQCISRTTSQQSVGALSTPPGSVSSLDVFSAQVSVTSPQRSPNQCSVRMPSYRSACSSSVSSISLSDDDGQCSGTASASPARVRVSILKAARAARPLTPTEAEGMCPTKSPGDLAAVLSSFRAINLPCGGLHEF